MNEKSRQRKKKKRLPAGEPYPVTRAVTHIRLVEVNPGKLAALDALAPVYLALCQAYVTLFCTTEPPNKLRDPLYQTPLSYQSAFRGRIREVVSQNRRRKIWQESRVQQHISRLRK